MTIGHAQSVVAATIGEVISLSGTDGSPNTFVDTSIDPADAEASWGFEADGDIFRYKLAGSDAKVGEWSSLAPTPGSGYYIKATQTGVTTPGSAPNAAGSASMDTWLALSSDRYWGWSRTSVGSTQGEIRVDIATDSGGSNIVATGYYRATATVDI